MALSRGAVGWSAVCGCGIPDHTHLLFCKWGIVVLFLLLFCLFIVVGFSTKEVLLWDVKGFPLPLTQIN